MATTPLKDIDLIINSELSKGGIKSFDANNQIIPNVGTPVNVNDASNKQYVDSKLESFFEFAAYYNAGNFPITARIPNYQPVNFYSSPFFFRNNPVTSVLGNEISLPAGKYIITYRTIISDDTTGNNDTNFISAFRIKGATNIIPESLSGFNVSGSNAAIPYTNYNSFFLIISNPEILNYEVSVDTNNWSVKDASIYISFRKV